MDSCIDRHQCCISLVNNFGDLPRTNKQLSIEWAPSHSGYLLPISDLVYDDTPADYGFVETYKLTLVHEKIPSTVRKLRYISLIDYRLHPFWESPLYRERFKTLEPNHFNSKLMVKPLVNRNHSLLVSEICCKNTMKSKF